MAEFSIIDRYFHRPLNKPEKGEIGIGDDSAIINPPAGQQLIICTDTLIAGRHFPNETPAHAIGWKSVAVNLSDIAAMGAQPKYILLAVNLAHIDHNWLEQFSQGLFSCCDQFGVKLIGGDTTQSPQLSITVTALGYIEHGQAIKRSGAEVGDLIVVSGQLGDAAYALQHRFSKLQHRLDYPTPRCELGQSLKGLASSMIDLSDGLVQDLQHILHQSHVGAQVFLEQLPLDSCLSNLANAQKWQYALAGGDDYELCFTIAPRNYEKLLQQQLDTKVTIIGQIVADKELIFQYKGQKQSLQLQGYQHFA